ncbi:MAG TPA: hypothetical protein VN493_07065 [Thermoanaerobaculia bacterium]|nr:hypothetical protein [Thermoanaerobaculia bacterium]
MTRSEYEARRRRLDEELRVAMDLVKAGHQAQVQMLDLLWRTAKAAAADSPIPTAPPLPEPEPRPRRRGPGELMDEMMALLPQLPQLFTKDDVGKALSEPADRASLLRVLRELESAGWLRTESRGRGRYPTSYRRLVSAASPSDPRDAAEPS